MLEYKFVKPNTYIKDLPVIQNIDPQFVDNLDNHFFNYVEMHLPFYQEMKRRGADVFKCQNISKMGEDGAERYEYDGHNYWFMETPLWGITLALDGHNHYEDLQWKSIFWDKYPQYDESIWDNNWKDKNTHFFHWYMQRYYKKDPKYNVVQDRMKEYFRYLTQDPEIVFDVGWDTFIYWDTNIKAILDWHPSIYY